jgi:glc operon protein GlcG
MTKTICNLALTLTIGSALVSGADLATRKALTLEVAKQMAAAAEAEAVKNKWNVVIAIVDEGANLVYLQRMDETQIGSIDVATQKAQSAIKFKRPTKAFEDAVAGGRNVILKLPGAMPVEGGLPISADGRIIGAIGVSGVTSQQDAQIGQAGVNALPKILGK